MIIFWVNGRRVDLDKWLKEMFERLTPEQQQQFRRNVTRDVPRDVAKQKRDREGFWTN
jgi:Spy/CpxP family protein refolding chaperone